MKPALVALLLVATMCPAFAAAHHDRSHSQSAPAHPQEVSCKPMAEAMKDLGSDATERLTPGQFHFVEGLYVGSPTTPPGLPPGDGAVIVAAHGGAIVIWTRGSMACSPLPISESLVSLVRQIKTGKDEDAPVSSPPTEGLKDCMQKDSDACAL